MDLFGVRATLTLSFPIVTPTDKSVNVWNKSFDRLSEPTPDSRTTPIHKLFQQALRRESFSRSRSILINRPVLTLALKRDGWDELQLREFADNTLIDRLTNLQIANRVQLQSDRLYLC